MMCLPLMGSLDRLFGVSLGKVVFLRITLIKLHSNRRGGVRLWGGDVHRVQGYSGIRPPFLQYMRYPIKNNDILKKVF
jgi:hypothetical protein